MKIYLIKVEVTINYVVTAFHFCTILTLYLKILILSINSALSTIKYRINNK